MRLASILVVLIFSFNAYADYFICTIRVNGNYLENSADYRGRETRVILDGYSCAGKMVDRLVTTTISSKWYGVIVEDTGDMSSESVFQDTSYKGEPLDLVTCKCGLN